MNKHTEEHITHPNLIKLAQTLQDLCLSKQKTLGLAESCSGGAIAGIITQVSNASHYFKGGIVAYTNEVKENILGVKKSALELEGAVSQTVGIAMAKGALNCFNCDIALATTGIAGPEGGTTKTPVGTVFIVIENRTTGGEVFPLHFTGDRSTIIAKIVATSLQKLIDHLLII